MAKSARASKVKSNNQKLKANVFGPVEDARAERLYAKMRALIAQPKPSEEKKEVEMEVDQDTEEAPAAEKSSAENDDETMEIDSGASKAQTKRRKGGVTLGKSGIAKRKAKKSAIVFPTRKRKQLIPAKKSSA